MAEVLPQETELVIEGESSEVSADGYSYKIDLYTGDSWRAGTDANVLVTIFGENGDSGQRILNNSGNVFERDSTDSFKIVSNSYLGPIKKIIIAHDNSGLNPSWFLNKVTVEDVKSREVFEFPCRRWLATDEDDGLISRELLWSVVKVKEKEMRENYLYTINIYTGTAWGAGTDANVYITIYGTNSRSRKCKLKNKGHSTFESGMKDTCKLETKNPLGTLYKIRVGHDNTGLGPGWLLDKIEVEDDITGEIIKFACGKWLSTTSEDGLICRDLMREGFVEEEKPSLETFTYTVNIFTGHKWGAGTDANVFLTLYGTNGESPQQKIENEGSTTFENGMTDTYKFDCPYLGTLTKIRIGHDNTGWGPAWYLDKVTVEDTKNGDVVEFPCSRWLATNADDGMIERELVRKDGLQVDGKKSQIDDREEIEGNETQEGEERVGEEKETEKKRNEAKKSKKDVKKEMKEKEKQQLKEKAGEGKETEKRQKKAKDGSKSKKDIKKEKKEKERQELKERSGKEKEKEKQQNEEKESELLEEFLFFTQEPTLMAKVESGGNGKKQQEIKTKELKEKPIMEEMIQVQEEGTVMADNFDSIEREWLEKERQEKEKQALLERERQETEKQALLEKERREKEKQELLEKERQEKEKQELLEKERQETEKQALLEKERQEKEKQALLEKDRQEREKQELLEKERQEKEKQALLEKERQEKEKQALLEKERQENEKQALLKKERQENEKQALLKKERQEREKQALLEKERQETEKQALLEKERQETEKQALLEKERQEKEKQALLEKERKEKEKQELLEKERQEKEKQALLEKERQEKEKQALLEKEKRKKEKQALLEKERREKEKQALLEKERRENEKQALLEKERRENEKQALLEIERQEKEKQALLEKERREKEKQAILEKERQEKEKQALLEKERQEREKQALLEKERQEKEKQALLEKERREKEKQALLEKERREKEKQELLEKERQEREKQALLEKERQEKEKQALLEKERREKEKQALLEKERQEKEKHALLEKERKNKSELWKQQDIKVTFQNVNVTANLKSKALGMESGDIKDKQVTASSHTKVTHPSWARLNHPSSWCAGKLHSSWLQVDLESQHWVTAVATQGNPKGYKDYVKKLKIQHSQDGKIWTTYEENGNQLFDANVDYTTIKAIELQKAILARYIRICPLEWHVWPCMRMELYGSPLTKDEKLRKK